MTTSPQNKSPLNAMILGTIVQIAMVTIGHYNSVIKNGFAIGGMTISLIFGAMAARNIAARGSATLIAFLVGGGCALIGIAVSFMLSDVPAAVMGFGTVGSAVAGAIGGLIVHAVARHKPAVQ